MIVFSSFDRGRRKQVSIVSATWRGRSKCFHSGRHGNSYCLPSMSHRAANTQLVGISVRQIYYKITKIRGRNSRMMPASSLTFIFILVWPSPLIPWPKSWSFYILVPWNWHQIRLILFSKNIAFTSLITDEWMHRTASRIGHRSGTW